MIVISEYNINEIIDIKIKLTQVQIANKDNSLRIAARSLQYLAA